MDVSIEKLEKSCVKLTVRLAPHEVQPYLDAAARELSKEHPVKGFRPGSVPFAMMRSVAGDDALVKNTLTRLVPKTYLEAVMDREDVEAIGRPEVEAKDVTIGEGWTYEATVAVIPDVRLGDYTRISEERKEQAADAGEVNQELETLRKMRAAFITVPRPAQNGDRVDVDIQTTAGGIPLEGGSARGQAILLGEDHLLPGFDEQLIGMREGETKTFSLTIPEKHHQLNLRGRTVDFTVSVKTVQKRVLPEVNDAFAQGLGAFTDVNDLRGKLAANIKEEKEEHERQRIRQSLLRQVMETATFGELPDVLVEGELNTMLGELGQGVSAMGLTTTQVLQHIKKTKDELREGLKPKAVARVRAGLTLRAVAKAEGVTVEDHEVEKETQAALRQFADVEEAKKRVDLDELAEVARGTVRNRKVFALLERFAGTA